MAADIRDRDGRLLSNKCTPAAATHVADCTILATYTRDAHVEVAVAKHLAVGDAIVPVLFAHREYGEGAGQRAEAWIASAQGQRTIADFIDWVDAIGLRMAAH